MKRRITLSIALVLSIVCVALTSSDSRVGAQNQIKIAADTGVITLGPNQILRITAVNRSRQESTIRFRSTQYSQAVCAGGVCKQTATAVNTTPPLTLAPGEAASTELANSPHGVRVVAAPDEVDYDNWTFFTAIINGSTGEVVTSWATFPSS
jgi:hypothetical protein